MTKGSRCISLRRPRGSEGKELSWIAGLGSEEEVKTCKTWVRSLDHQGQPQSPGGFTVNPASLQVACSASAPWLWRRVSAATKLGHAAPSPKRVLASPALSAHLITLGMVSTSVPLQKAKYPLTPTLFSRRLENPQSFQFTTFLLSSNAKYFLKSILWIPRE